jgi:regulator of protease activity HflC (stomatin/prohibitin superfamily)
MWTTYYVKASERGVLYDRNDFRRILMPGIYRIPWFAAQRIETHDLNLLTAPLANLELLQETHGARLERYVQLLQTGCNQVALVRFGRNWISYGPNQLKAFWRSYIDVEVQLFDLDQQVELPAEFVNRVRGITIDHLVRYQVNESDLGLLFIDDNFVRALEPGEYAFWTFNHRVNVRNISRLTLNPNFPQEEMLVQQHPEFVAAYGELVETSPDQITLVRDRGRVIAMLSPASRRLFLRGVAVEQISISTTPKLPPQLVTELVSGHKDVLLLCHEYMHMLDVPAQHMGLLYIDGVLQDTLTAGLHVWWKFGHTFKSEAIDLRLQVLDVSGQEILSKDKVPLRLNLTAGYKIADPVRAKAELTNIGDFLYKELQFGLRAAVGTRSLDALLEDKGAIDTGVSDYIRSKASPYGIAIESVGVKDIILPGEIKTILSKVVEAEKAAQANVVRRREETAATRSMLNTAKVMEDNPVALRLKELEVLERIAEKIERINVNGSLDSILTELVRLKQP